MKVSVSFLTRKSCYGSALTRNAQKCKWKLIESSSDTSDQPNENVENSSGNEHDALSFSNRKKQFRKKYPRRPCFFFNLNSITKTEKKKHWKNLNLKNVSLDKLKHKILENSYDTCLVCRSKDYIDSLIQCTICKRWLHDKCTGIDVSTIDDFSYFYHVLFSKKNMYTSTKKA